jgi:hypothetical protein
VGEAGDLGANAAEPDDQQLSWRRLGDGMLRIAFPKQ